MRMLNFNNEKDGNKGLGNSYNNKKKSVSPEYHEHNFDSKYRNTNNEPVPYNAYAGQR
jgi:hypothetical protein